MENFIRFGRVSLIVALIGSCAGKIIFDLAVESSESASISGFIMAVISYGTFSTLTYGFILCAIWVFINLSTYLLNGKTS